MLKFWGGGHSIQRDHIVLKRISCGYYDVFRRMLEREPLIKVRGHKRVQQTIKYA